jgi:MSHA biogenesis protein MshO
MGCSTLQKGFTLTELIIVIVLLGIISIIPISFIRYSAEGALDTANRQRLAMAAGVISEQISREIRAALPGSVRLNAGDTCLEYIPIVASTVYRNAPIVSARPSFPALPLSNAASSTGYVAIYPYAATTNELYTPTTPGVISPMTATLPSGNGTVNIAFTSGTHQFVTDSPRRRVFMVDTPVTYCQEDRFVYRYSGYGFQPTVAAALPTALDDSTGTGREVIGAPLEADSLSFSVIPPSLQRNGLITFEFSVQSEQSDERIYVTQEVQLRNVP